MLCCTIGSRKSPRPGLLAGLTGDVSAAFWKCDNYECTSVVYQWTSLRWLPTGIPGPQNIYHFFESRSGDPASIAHHGAHRIARNVRDGLQLLGHPMSVEGHNG